jgi:type I restriction enzyme M protein
MLSPHIKKKVDKLWDRFWSAGLTNPLVAIEQITYLLFLKRLEDVANSDKGKWLAKIYHQTKEDKKAVFDPAKCKWSYITNQKTDTQHLRDYVFPWLRTIEKRIAGTKVGGTEIAEIGSRMADAYFQLDPNKGAILGEAIDLIGELFSLAGESSAAQDVMGDTFEYLLGEISTAGKNGQFRTPRHLIRFMVELLDPQPGMRIVDPAAGTGGFLFSSQQYLLRKYTPEGNLRIEWDGAPHRLDGTEATPEQYAAIHNGGLFIGIDNDRTMARIGWMNLILHGLENPQIVQGDSLSKREGKQTIARLMASESSDIVLANPPFTGTVDTDDLEPDSRLFPRVAKGKKAQDAITNKSELLFVWLMLDLLQVGGRCAVIVPEGVLFGNTDAHVRLRKELLTEHVVEGIISLPGGVFQPYTGVKTSILVFRKETKRDEKGWWKGNNRPRTESVWFYEVEADGYSLDAKRNAQPGKDNDLWDALEKFRIWLSVTDNVETNYFQPSYHRERWRMVDNTVLARFPGKPEVQDWHGKIAAIHELFPEISTAGIRDPNTIEEELIFRTEAELNDYFLSAYRSAAALASKEIKKKPLKKQTQQEREEIAKKYLDKVTTEVKKPVNQCKQYFDDPSDNRGWKFFQEQAEHARQKAYDAQFEWLSLERLPLAVKDVRELPEIALDFAKLDGFDVTLRTSESEVREGALKTSRHWIIPVRDYARNDDWKSEDGSLLGSHDENGETRPEYVQTNQLYDEDGKLNAELLDPDCIEACEWNLSAGQYKPFDSTFAVVACDATI